MNEILQKIDLANHIVVIAHKDPDIDCLGSASAMYTYLLQKHKKVSFFCATSNINKRFSFLPWFEKIRSSFPSSADLAIAFDCTTRSQIGISVDCNLINIDHHAENDEFGNINLINSVCISTTEVIYSFFKMNSIMINKKMATSLYSGLLANSNGFLSSNISSTTFEVSKDLIEAGADFKVCNTFVRQYQTLSGLRLKAIMLSKMELVHNGKIALFLVTNDDMKQSGACSDDCESALEESLFLPTVKVSLLLKENTDLFIKGTLRVKDTVNLLSIGSIFDFDNKSDLYTVSKIIINRIKKEI